MTEWHGAEWVDRASGGSIEHASRARAAAPRRRGRSPRSSGGAASSVAGGVAAGAITESRRGGDGRAGGVAPGARPRPTAAAPRNEPSDSTSLTIRLADYRGRREEGNGLLYLPYYTNGGLPMTHIRS